MWFHESEIVWRSFDLGASFIWAISGALMAATRGYDLTGIAAIALVSSTGGGLLRDAPFLQEGPPSLVRTPIYIIVAGMAALLVWLLGREARILRPFERFAGLVDAVGLGAAITIVLVALLRTGSVRYGLRTHAAGGFVEAPVKDERVNAPMT